VRRVIFICFALIIILLNLMSCKTNGDEEGLKKLEELKQAYLWNTHSERAIDYLYKFKDEALKQENSRYTATAYYYLSGLYMVRVDSVSKDSAFYATDKATEYYQKAGYKTGEILAGVRKIELLIEEGSFELALENASQLLANAQGYNDKYMIASVYRAFASIYMYYNRLEDALEMADLATDSYLGCDNFEDMLPDYNYLILFKVLITNLLGDNELSLLYSEEYQEGIEKEKISESAKRDKRNIVSLYVISNLIDMNRLDEAEVLMKEFQTYIDEQKSVNDKLIMEQNLLLANYNLKKHFYEKALFYIEAIDPRLLVYVDFITVLEKKIEILKAKGDYKNALKVRTELYQYTDSLHRKSTTKQLEKLKYSLHLEQQAAENEVKMKYIRIIIILLSFMSISLVVMFSIKRHAVKLLRRKNELLFMQYRSMDKCVCRSEVSDSLTKELQSTEQATDLFDKAEIYLDNTQCFKNPDISRESLAGELGTNRQYLTEAIQKRKKMTFMEYINEKRLEYARRLLCYNLELSIDEIFVSSGFNSKSTFYRLFKQKYDLTPKEVRELAVKDK